MGQLEPFRIEGLTGREYKIMLEPGRFGGTPDKAARRFWNRLAPIVARHMAGKAGPGGFDDVFPKPASKRRIRFSDTPALLLDKQGYSLRVREDDHKREVSLKLRMPDVLVSGLAALGGSSDDAEPKFEEDIAPLEVQQERSAERPTEPSIRSRFSRSTKQPFAARATLASLDEAFRLFPDLRGNLTTAIGRAPPAKTPLKQGPDIREYVFKSEDIKLSLEAKVEFSITIWYLDRASEPDKAATPDVAEVSFTWKLETADQDEDEQQEAKRWERNRRGAARNLDLFLAIQKRLSGWIDKNNASKTKLGLPGQNLRRRRASSRR